MIASGSRKLWTVAFLLAGGAVVDAAAEKPTSVTAAEPVIAAKPPIATKSLSELIRDLDSNRFVVRREATRKLVEMGRPAVAPLVEAAGKGSLEVSVRAIGILEAMFAGQTDAIDDAETALERLMVSKNRSAAGRADSVLLAHSELRESRALTAIRKLGGLVKPGTRVGGNPRMFIPNNPRASGPSDYQIWLSENWKGGDEGLKYVKRLRRLETLYNIKGNGVTQKGLEDLRAALPFLQIQDRGKAYLGIGGATNPFGGIGCYITRVQTGSAAERGGIQEGDSIVRFGGKEVVDFDALISLIKEKNAGDKVVVEVIRSAKALKLDVVLAGWK